MIGCFVKAMFEITLLFNNDIIYTLNAVRSVLALTPWLNIEYTYNSCSSTRFCEKKSSGVTVTLVTRKVARSSKFTVRTAKRICETYDSGFDSLFDSTYELMTSYCSLSETRKS